MEKFYLSKALLKMASGGKGMHPPLDPPLVLMLLRLTYRKRTEHYVFSRFYLKILASANLPKYAEYNF